jgi:ribonuclease BN (tRNA processing enzyme)
VGSIGLTFSRTDHGPETLAVRVDGASQALGYTADTGPGWSIDALGKELDLVLCEATIPAVLEGHMQHLSARQAGASAREAGARRLVLTHIWPTLDLEKSKAEGSEAFGAEADLAAVGRSFAL